MDVKLVSLPLTQFTVVVKEGVRKAAAVRELLRDVEAAPEQSGPHRPLLRGHVGLPRGERGQPGRAHLQCNVLPVIQRNLVKGCLISTGLNWQKLV